MTSDDKVLSNSKCMDRRMRTFSFLLTLLSLLFAVKAEIFASCNTLSLQWNHTAGNVLEGTLSVTREANTVWRNVHSIIYSY